MLASRGWAVNPLLTFSALYQPFSKFPRPRKWTQKSALIRSYVSQGNQRPPCSFVTDSFRSTGIRYAFSTRPLIPVSFVSGTTNRSSFSIGLFLFHEGCKTDLLLPSSPFPRAERHRRSAGQMLRIGTEGPRLMEEL